MKHPFASTSTMKELNEMETDMVGGGLRPICPPTVTTLAIGEEGGSPKPPTVTTLAVGEEGGSPGGPIFTTLALGEEGGTGRPIF